MNFGCTLSVPVKRGLKLHTGPHVVSAIGLHIFLLYYYLNRDGYIFIGVTLFVSQIVEILLDRFSQNSAKKVARVPRKNPLAFGGNYVNTTLRVPTLLLTKNPGLFQDFPGPHEKFSRTFSEPANV